MGVYFSSRPIKNEWEEVEKGKFSLYLWEKYHFGIKGNTKFVWTPFLGSFMISVNDKAFEKKAVLNSEKSIRPDTSLVSIMTVNNEIGVLQPIADIGKLCRSRKVIIELEIYIIIPIVPPCFWSAAVSWVIWLLIYWAIYWLVDFRYFSTPTLPRLWARSLLTSTRWTLTFSLSADTNYTDQR